MERAGARERFHSRIPEGPTTSRFARLHSLAAGGANPAKWFYDWIDVGTPVSFRGHWPAPTLRVEKPALAGSFIQKIIIPIVTTTACVVIILLVWRRRGKV